MKDCVWLKPSKNKNELRQEIKNFHIALQAGGPEFKAIQRGIDRFPKRLICVLEFKGQNVDNNVLPLY